jgi:hypothetical protein
MFEVIADIGLLGGAHDPIIMLLDLSGMLLLLRVHI